MKNTITLRDCLNHVLEMPESVIDLLLAHSGIRLQATKVVKARRLAALIHSGVEHDRQA